MRAWLLVSIASVVLVVCDETATASISSFGIGPHLEYHPSKSSEDISILDYPGHIEDDFAVFQEAYVFSRHGSGKCNWNRVNTPTGNVHFRTEIMPAWEEHFLKTCAWPNIGAIDDIQPNSWGLTSILDGDVEFRDSINSDVSNYAVKYSDIRPYLLLADFPGDGDGIFSRFRSLGSGLGSSLGRVQRKSDIDNADDSYRYGQQGRPKHSLSPQSHIKLSAKVFMIALTGPAPLWWRVDGLVSV